MWLKDYIVQNLIRFFDKLNYYFYLSSKIDNLFKEAVWGND
jgi:hypothetical protein